MRWVQGKPGRVHASTGVRVPLHRSEDLILEELGDELLIYDKTNQRAHCLSADAARVWRACDGKTDVGKLSAQLGLPLDVVRQAVDELGASRLLDPGLELVNLGYENGDGRGVTRREMAVRTAKVGAAAATAPLILSITAPIPTAAATVVFAECGKLTGSSCGNNAGQCGNFLDCCCCCGYGDQPGQCMACTPQGQCPTTGNCNATNFFTGPNSRADCSSDNTGNVPPPANGCCGISGAGNCGCLWSPTGAPGVGTGLVGSGPGCCVPGATPAESTTCAPGSGANCVPCCQGVAINLATAVPGCCSTTTNNC